MKVESLLKKLESLAKKEAEIAKQKRAVTLELSREIPPGTTKDGIINDGGSLPSVIWKNAFESLLREAPYQKREEFRARILSENTKYMIRNKFNWVKK